VTVAIAASKLTGDIKVVKPGDKLTVKGIPIEVVSAYNLTKFRSPGNPFHPKEAGYVGFIVTVDGERIYHTGDADVIPEMKSLKVDIALLPVSGTYVMTADEAVEAADLLHPKAAIPMHVGRGIGELDMAEEFKQKASVPVEVLPIEG
jgi:L-ascorbate metabolism protein UlaG (beta-lactamase superfamily)